MGGAVQEVGDGGGAELSVPPGGEEGGFGDGALGARLLLPWSTVSGRKASSELVNRRVGESDGSDSLYPDGGAVGMRWMRGIAILLYNLHKD